MSIPDPMVVKWGSMRRLEINQFEFKLLLFDNKDVLLLLKHVEIIGSSHLLDSMKILEHLVKAL